MRIDVAVVGAGPYGLSLAAHLAGSGVNLRVFGLAMESWQRMPVDMFLKSDGFASNLSSPDPYYSLKSYCQIHGVPYDDTQVPVKLETFVEYGRWFQKNLVPELDQRKIVHIERGNGNFILLAEDGDRFEATRVVLAVGISEFSWMPHALRCLPPDLVTHSSQHRPSDKLAGKEVAIIGGGSSAIDLAALLQDQGVDVTIIARRNAIEFHEQPAGERTLRRRLRNPSSGLGPGWKSRIFTEVPYLFRYLPGKMRVKIVREHLGPAAGWWMRERVMGKIPMYLGARALTATASEGRVQLFFQDGNCQRVERSWDHVIAATGYRPYLDRLRFLSQPIQKNLRTLANAPVLSSRFESSVPGLYFVGLASAYSFGPMMRFAFGTGYTARVLARHLQGKTSTREAKLLAYRREAAEPDGLGLTMDHQEKAG